MRITPGDCDKARMLNNGRIYLDSGKNYVDPECNLEGIHFFGVGKSTTIITNPSGTKHDDKVIQGILNAMPELRSEKG